MIRPVVSNVSHLQLADALRKGKTGKTGTYTSFN